MVQLGKFGVKNLCQIERFNNLLLLLFIILLPAVCLADELINKIQPSISINVIKKQMEVARFGGGPSRILVIAGIHGDEPQSVQLAHTLIDEFKFHRALLRESVELVIVPKANPIGYREKTRGNARGVDLNRNFPTSDWSLQRKAGRYYSGSAPASEAETQILLSIIREQNPSLVIAIHAPLRLVNYDGPAGEIATFLAKELKIPLRKEIGYQTPGSLGRYLGIEQGIPTLTLELPHRPSLGVISSYRNALIKLFRIAPTSDLERGHLGSPSKP